MKIDVVTIFPEMIEGAVKYGVLGQALKEERLQIASHTPRNFTEDRHRHVDDRPFGGGDGMLMLAEPLQKCLNSLKHNNSRVIYLSPQGATLSDEKARALANEEHLILICGRYGGIDQRVLNENVDEEISIGDYVLSGGEIAALVVVDSLSRFIPEVLGHSESANQDSFSQGLLEEPHFTRPREFLYQVVPEVLLSGNHKAIAHWRKQVAALVTLQKRPDLFLIYLDEQRADLAMVSKKKRPDPLSELLAFWRSLEPKERLVLGLTLQEKDFHV